MEKCILCGVEKPELSSKQICVKKALCCVLILFLLSNFCSCGKQVSEYAHEHGQISIEIIDDYLAGNLTADTAKNKLQVQVDLIRDNCDKIQEETGKYPFGDSSVATNIALCRNAVFNHDFGSGSKESIKEAVKDLKKAMNR